MCPTIEQTSPLYPEPETLSTNGIHQRSYESEPPHTFEEHPLASSFTSSSIDTFHCLALSQLGLVVNTKHNILICMECQSVVAPSSLRRHLSTHKSKYPHIKLHNLLHALVSAVPSWSLLTEHPPHPTETVAPIFGLRPPQLEYVICIDCNRGFYEQRDLQRHTCQSRMGPQGSQFKIAPVQRFYNNTRSSWFPVSVAANVQSTQDDITPRKAYQELASQRSALDKTASVSHNWRVIHPFLYHEKWLEHIQGYNIENLVALVSESHNRQDPLAKLNQHIFQYLSFWQERIDNILLARIIGIRPTPEHEVVYIKSHRRVQPSSLHKYSTVMARALYLLLRVHQTPSSEYTFPIPSPIRSACDALLRALQDPRPAVLGDALLLPFTHTEEMSTATLSLMEYTHDGEETDDEDEGEDSRDDNVALMEVDQDVDGALLSEGLTNIYYALETLLQLLFTQVCDLGRFTSPLVRYLVLSSVSVQQRWSSKSEITQKIAALLFVGRITMGNIVKNAMGKDKTLNYNRLV